MTIRGSTPAAMAACGVPRPGLGLVRLVELDHLGRLALHDHEAVLDEDGPVAVLGHPAHVVGDQDDRLGRTDDAR